MFDDNDQRWIDESLREVHVPAELIARLKEVGEDHDAILDGVLCAVPVPDRLIAILKDVPDDARLDASLRSVPVSAEFLEQLKSLPNQTAVDLALRDVAVPAELAERLKTIRAEPTVRLSDQLASSRLSWVAAAAAAVLLIAGTVYFAKGYLAKGDRQKVVDLPRHLGEQHREELVQNDRSRSFDEIGAASATPTEASEPPAAIEPSVVENPPSTGVVREPERSLLELLALDIEWPDDNIPVLLGMPGRLLPPPPAARAPRLVLRGITAPAVREYDLLSLARTGIHPFVSPGAHPKLRSIAVPVVVANDGLDAIRAPLRSDQTPDRSAIRTEEFLAAVSEPPLSVGVAVNGDEPVMVSVKAGPSPWSESRRFLIKVDLWANGDAAPGAPLVAEEARLSVTFRPEAVKLYRLLGHEADVGGGLLPGPLKADLRAGDVATAVFEIELQPIPIGDLATVQYSWRNPDGGEFQEHAHLIRRSQLAPTFVEIDPALQLTTIAAATAELLRKSPHLSDQFAVDDIIALSDAVHPSLYDDARLNALLDLLEAME